MIGSFGGAAGSTAYRAINDKSKETAIAKDRVVETQDEIKTITQQYVEEYLSQDPDVQNGIIKSDDVSEDLAQRAAEIVTANLRVEFYSKRNNKRFMEGTSVSAVFIT